MRNLKKILALVLALMMVLSVMVTSSAAFEDADEIQHTEAVEVMSNLGILLGDGTNFNPNGTLTRAQAAVIIAKMLEGSVDNISVLVDAVDNPFTDVPAWALDYVLYAYSKGVVRGTSADKYTPNKNLTGYEFGKMVLVAAGICKDADFNNNWKMTVAEELKDNKLLTGLSDLVLSKDLSREHAAQLAFNAMNHATNSTYGYSVYDIATGAVLGFYPTMIEAAQAAKILSDTVTTYTYSKQPVPQANDSLAVTVFGLSTNPITDGIGFEGYKWYVNVDGVAGYNPLKDVYVSSFVCTDKVVGIFTKANAEKEVVAALGKTTDVTGTVWANGTETNGTKTFGAKSNTKVETDSDVTLTVAVDANKNVKFLYAREYLTFAARGNKVTDKTSPAYGLYSWSFNHESTLGTSVATVYAAADAYTNGAAYLVVPTAVPVITAAKALVGNVTAKGYGYLKLNGVAYNLSDLGITATVNTTTPVTVYLNTAGDVIYIGGVGAAAPTVYDGYVYVTALQYVATPYIATGLVGTGSEAGISAKAIVTTPAGETLVVDVATNVKKVNAYTYVPQYWLNGQFVNAAEYNTTVTPFGGSWMAYTLDENGAYKLDAMSTQTVTSATNYKAVVGVENVNYYMDANTEIAFYYYNLDTGAVEAHTATGYADYKSGTYMYNQEAIVVADPVTKVISSITFYSTKVVADSVNYAVFAGLLEESVDGNWYGFIVNGEVKPYLSTADLSALVAGDIVDLKTDVDGVVTSAHKTTLNNTGKVVTAISADGSYFICGSEVFYLDDYGCVVYDATLGYTAGELAVGQTVSFYNHNTYGVDIIVITAHPAE